MARTRSPSFPNFCLVLGLLVLLTVGSVAAQEVRLSLEDYEALRARANPPPDPAVQPEVPVAFEEARITVETGEESARVTQVLTLVLDATTWHTLELPAEGAFLNADFGELEGFVEEGENGESSRLRVRGSGRYVVTLDSVVPLVRDETATRETRRLALTLPPAAVVSGELVTSPDVEEVDSDGSALVSESEEPGRWRFLGKPGEAVRLTLLGAARGPSREDLPLRFEVATGTAVRISRTRTRADAWIQARVLEGRLEALTASLPDGWEVVRVGSQPKASWDGAGGRLVVTPVEPVEGALTVSVELTREPVDSIRAPVLTPEGAGRAERFSRVHVAGDGLLELVDAGGGRRILEPPPNMASVVARGPGALFRIDRGEAPLWDVVWSERAQVLAAEVPRMLVHVLAGEGRAFYRMWLETRNTGAASLDVRPPEGFDAVLAARDGSLLTPGLQGSSLVLPLTASEQGQVVFLSGFAPLRLPAGDGRFEIPLPSLSAPVREVEIRVLVPSRRRYELADPTRRGRVGPPPAVMTSADDSMLRQNVAQLRRIIAEGFGTADDALDPPLGFQAIDAAWVALSPSVSPLVLEVSDPRSRKEWF